MKTYLCTVHTLYWPNEPDSFTERPPCICGSSWLREMPPLRASSCLSGGGAGLAAAAAITARGRGLFASTPGQNSGAEQNCSLSGCAKAGGYSARHHKPPCVCGCPNTGRWRFPPCCFEIAAVATSRVCTIFRRLRMCEAQRVIFSKKKLADVECRITAEHYDGGDLHAFSCWHAGEGIEKSSSGTMVCGQQLAPSHLGTT